MKLTTDRLLLLPLTHNQLELYLQADNKLEEELGLARAQRVIPQELAEAFQETILPAVADKSKNYLFTTLWTIISKEHNQMVADLCFKGEPTDKGQVEIGYGTYDAYQGKGYMTEAIKAIVTWAFSQPGVTAVLGETEKDNLASHRTLEKNTFVRYKQEENMIWWRLDKNHFIQN
ncbi:GNAT family N-acetyltransferase [Pontibacter locisalis]|uniref:GNAT family N-acetyltransferase n=1 Tax=Pontibacter locisalis TaxID=1719035 RepID=A0ABW5IFU6_9BACT